MLVKESLFRFILISFILFKASLFSFINLKEFTVLILMEPIDKAVLRRANRSCVKNYPGKYGTSIPPRL